MRDHPNPVPEPPARLPAFDTTTQFVDSAKALLEQIEHLGNHLGCPSTTWSWKSTFDYRRNHPQLPILSGHISHRRPDFARQTARQWANALGLTVSTTATRGTVTYEGEVHGLKVQVWAVVDDAAFGSKRGSLKTYAPDWILTGLLLASATATGVVFSRHRKLTHAAKALTR